jgi:hypothetical protein
VKVVKVAFVVMAGILLGGASAAMAQDSVVAKVPFAFVVNGVKLPAGNYTISRDTNSPALMSIARADGRRSTLTMSHSVDVNRATEQAPQLEFTKVGGQYQLSRIVLGYDYGRGITLTPAREDDGSSTQRDQR